MKSSYITTTILSLAVAFGVAANNTDDYTQFVDPAIGSEGLGRVFIGPAMPFGMVRPGPDCTPSPNSGWLPMPERVDGFAQTHVSGTGGGPKYGNILIQPFIGDFSTNRHYAYREEEKISCGYYSTRYKDSGIGTEVTTAPRASVYRITYPQTAEKEGLPSLLVDAGFFLGESPVPDAREAQQFVGSEVSISCDNFITGYSRIRGGWNNGRAYTVYFCVETDPPFVDYATWQGEEISGAVSRTDAGLKTGAMVSFPASTDTVDVRVGISFISAAKAKENLITETSGKSFEQIHGELLDSWNRLLGRIIIAEDSPRATKRMFYTGLYHTMLMPSDRTGENPLWTDAGVPYYDDFYAIWDTYRTSMPLITLIDPACQADIVNALINIGKRDDYMPDARSGNCNGRTQGGSNADIAIADAYVKGLPGIDYEAALEQMLKDAEVDPGYDHEAHGRGGLNEYKSLGYVPFGIARAGNRTVEYSLCDFAVARVAEGLGKETLAEKYDKRSHNWQNLWRNDYEHDGARGFILPRDASGNWLDSLPFGHSEYASPRHLYTPLTFEGPWYTPWWNMFFYEASSWEYSLSMPHDVPALIEACGGAEAFVSRLETFFEKEYYNVNNEPSFLSPCLYHWVGRPDMSSDRVRSIIARHFGDSAKGLPGNDDSGAMSSWLAFHILGLYPNAAHPYYLINSPMVSESVISNPGGKPFRIVTENLSDKNRYIVSARLNGNDYPWSTLPHDSVTAGGELCLKMGSKPGKWGRAMWKGSENPVLATNPKPVAPDVEAARVWNDAKWLKADTVNVTYFLHGQKRKFRMIYKHMPDGGIDLVWGIERNLKWWEGRYAMSAEAVANGNKLSFIMPEDGNDVRLSDDETFGILSRKALQSLISEGRFELNGVEYEKVGEADGLIEAIDPREGSRVKILNRPSLPLIWKMENNPLEIDWEVQTASF